MTELKPQRVLGLYVGREFIPATNLDDAVKLAIQKHVRQFRLSEYFTLEAFGKKFETQKTPLPEEYLITDDEILTRDQVIALKEQELEKQKETLSTLSQATGNGRAKLGSAVDISIRAMESVIKVFKSYDENEKYVPDFQSRGGDYIALKPNTRLYNTQGQPRP